jgi:Spy/CpxP family protein refolding chaperone
MKGAKLFAASLVVFALTLGFFLGNLCGKCSMCDMCCKKAEMTQCPRHGMMPPPPPGAPHHPGEFRDGPKGPHGDFHKGPKFKGRMNPEAIDSLLEVTPEQKAAIEANRVKGDSIFKELRNNKHEAEKALGEALESGDQKAIEAAKAKVLDADKALLEHRILGVNKLSQILSKEQLVKFNQFRKEEMKKFREHKKDWHHGHKGPHGQPGEMPPPPPQE